MKKIKTKKTRRERALLRNQKRIESGSMNLKDLQLLPFDVQTEYLDRKIYELTGKVVNWSCRHCAYNVVFQTGNPVTDDELGEIHHRKMIF